MDLDMDAKKWRSEFASPLPHFSDFRGRREGSDGLLFLEQSVVIGLVGAIGVAHARDYVLQCVFVVFVPE